MTEEPTRRLENHENTSLGEQALGQPRHELAPQSASTLPRGATSRRCVVAGSRYQVSSQISKQQRYLANRNISVVLLRLTLSLFPSKWFPSN